MLTVSPIRLVDLRKLLMDSPASSVDRRPSGDVVYAAAGGEHSPPTEVRSDGANPVPAASVTPVSSCVQLPVPFVTHNPSLPRES